MRKYFALFLFLTSSLFSFSQEIGIAYSEDNGDFLIKGTESFWYGNEFATSLIYGKSKAYGNEVWELKTSVKAIVSEFGGDGRFSFDKGAKMYLLTESNKIIEAVQQDECGSIDHTSMYRAFFDNSTEYKIRPTYRVSNDDIIILSKESIIKIRMETTKGMKDIIFKTPMDLICREYNVLMNSIDINEGF